MFSLRNSLKDTVSYLYLVVKIVSGVTGEQYKMFKFKVNLFSMAT